MFCRLLFIRLALVFILFSIMGCRDLPEKQFHEENADEFFDKAVIQTIEINIAPADRQAMFDALPERIYVPATFVWRDMRLENVGVRFKGNSSSQPDSWWLRPYRLLTDFVCWLMSAGVLQKPDFAFRI